MSQFAEALAGILEMNRLLQVCLSNLSAAKDPMRPQLSMAWSGGQEKTILLIKEARHTFPIILIASSPTPVASYQHPHC
jgi:hypothetical protein